MPEEPADSILAWTLARLAAPSATPGSQTFVVGFNVTVSHNESGVTVRYTTDGSEPTESDSSVADGGTIAIGTSTTTLKLKSFQNTGSLTSEVVTYEYTYQAPTDLVPTPLHRFYYDFGWSVDDIAVHMQYAVAGLSGATINNSEDGGNTWAVLQGSSSNGVYYTDPTKILQGWTPSNYRAYATKVAYVDSNQRVVPDRCVPPMVWSQGVSYTTNTRLGIAVFGVNATLWRRWASKPKSSSFWSSWSTWQSSSGWSWGQWRTNLWNLTSDNTHYKWEFYLTQSGFQDSEVVCIRSFPSAAFLGGENVAPYPIGYVHKLPSYDD